MCRCTARRTLDIRTAHHLATQMRCQRRATLTATQLSLIFPQNYLPKARQHKPVYARANHPVSRNMDKMAPTTPVDYQNLAMHTASCLVAGFLLAIVVSVDRVEQVYIFIFSSTLPRHRPTAYTPRCGWNITRANVQGRITDRTRLGSNLFQLYRYAIIAHRKLNANVTFLLHTHRCTSVSCTHCTAGIQIKLAATVVFGTAQVQSRNRAASIRRSAKG